MAALTVEYLTLIRDPDSFCDSSAGFLQLLQVHSSITIVGSDIRVEGQDCCKHAIQCGDLKEKKQRYIQLKLDWQGDPEANTPELERFVSLLKIIRRIISKTGGEVETLRDDVSSHYALKAYPLIHDVENLMRRLIANFMLLNVGIEWTSEALPQEAEQALKNSKRQAGPEKTSKDYLNVLQKLDFIHLGNILFDPYSKKPIAELFAKLKAAKTEDDVTALQEFIPRSNWHRYFSNLVQCEDEYLNKRWKLLYDLRCKVAHNNLMSKNDLLEIHRLIAEVQPKLDEALEKLRQVTVPQVEVSIVAESAARNINEPTGEFIRAWQKLEATIANRFLLIDGIQRKTIPSGREIKDWYIMDRAELTEFQEVRELRNRIVHGHDASISSEGIRDATAVAEALSDAVSHERILAKLRRLSEDKRNDEIDETLESIRYEILNSDSLAAAMAETNATDFDIDEHTIEGVRFLVDECEIDFSFIATGEQMGKKMWHGTKISGKGTVSIDSDGDVEILGVVGMVEHDEPDEDSIQNDGDRDIGGTPTESEF